jgi:3-oxoacyl-[acyl-carrier protein] reductase
MIAHGTPTGSLTSAWAQPSERFAGRTAFITGGGIGFGRAFARALTAHGAAVVLADIDWPQVESTVAELTAAGHQALAVQCDVADEQQVDAGVAAAIERFGAIDILINNAGKHLTKYNLPFAELARSEVRALFDVNVIGVINCTVACRASMRERGGGVVLNLSSIGGYLSTTPYAVSKLAVRGLTVAFASELASDGIRVNAIAPGLLATENAMADLTVETVEKLVGELQMIKRLGQMDDAVNAMLFLCSDDASFVTGETLRVSGGYPLSL